MRPFARIRDAFGPNKNEKLICKAQRILHPNVNDSARGGKEMQVSERGRYEDHNEHRSTLAECLSALCILYLSAIAKCIFVVGNR